ncbi:TolC family protein [Apibacter muscae]|uniref:TolC family protein n=1 Tax=Apibacter muscae TaxID=2509004 RepID=A0A563DFQ9_9FLAO|nr:TolC family protein [Apibacter muscae]TWP29118.1 TolC family protein [Apibacter muscae]
MKIIKSIFFTASFLINILHTQSQTRQEVENQIITYSEFIKQVAENNLEYAAEKFNVSLAEAEIDVAKIIPDVELGLEGGSNNKSMGNSMEIGLGWTIELGGKRKARINLAKSEVELNKYLLQNFYNNLRADATLLYLQTLQNKQLLDVQKRSYDMLEQLAKSDSLRYKLGVIAHIDARQSKFEAQSMLNEIYEAETEWQNSIINLSLVMGKSQTDQWWMTEGDLNKFDRNFDLSQLITTAQNNRADAMAGIQNVKVSEEMLKLANANRIMDLGISAGLQLNGKATNEEAPSPYHTGVVAGLNIPLRFLNNRKGEKKIAEYTIQKSNLEYKQIELQIQTEITQAYNNYITSQKQVKQFKDHLLKQAEEILKGKMYSYQRGETSLLELLDAQRTHNDVQKSYYETIFNYASSLIELERVSGIWDIEF